MATKPDGAAVMSDSSESRTRTEGAERAARGAAPAVSVLVPVDGRPRGDGSGDLTLLFGEVRDALRDAYPDFEFLFLGEAGPGRRADGLGELARLAGPVRVVEAGESAEQCLLRYGAEEARGDLLLVLPPVRRVDAGALPELLRHVERGEADLVTARRWPRRDSWMERAGTRLVDALVEKVTGRRIRDSGCGVRALRAEVLRETPLGAGLSGFLPRLAARRGFRVEEIGCEQHDRDTEASGAEFGRWWRLLVETVSLSGRLRSEDDARRPVGLAGGTGSRAPS